MNNLIKFRTALKAKELGFDQPVQNRYKFDKILNKDNCPRYGVPINYNDICFQDDYRQYSSAPIQSELQAWLRYEHEISIEVYYYDYKYHFDIWMIDQNSEFVSPEQEEVFDSYEDALEAALNKTLTKLTTL